MCYTVHANFRLHICMYMLFCMMVKICIHFEFLYMMMVKMYIHVYFDFSSGMQITHLYSHPVTFALCTSKPWWQQRVDTIMCGT